jgi:hypothetical protein
MAQIMTASRRYPSRPSDVPKRRRGGLGREALAELIGEDRFAWVEDVAGTAGKAVFLLASTLTP